MQHHQPAPEEGGILGMVESGPLLGKQGVPPGSWGRRGAVIGASLMGFCTALSLAAWAAGLASPRGREAALAESTMADGLLALQGKRAVEGCSKAACSWEGENCISTKCCKRTGLTCWERTANVWGGCSKSCAELQQFGGDWTCAALGSAGEPKLALPAATEPAAVSLFCFTVVTAQGVCPPGVKEGYEQLLLDQIKAAQVSIYECEGSAVFQGLRAETGEWKSIKNTDVFVQVWKDVQGNGQYAQHDWTVKVDVDCVFLPARLKMHLTSMKPQANQAIYLHNIDFKFHFMGALEVMSREAVDALLQGLQECLDHIGNEGGEDIFTMECLDALGVSYMEDYSLLDDKYSNPDRFNLFDIDRCHNDATVAFHPYKAVNSWMGCRKVAMGENQPEDFTSCEHRWDGEACSLSGTLDHPGHTDPGTGIVA